MCYTQNIKGGFMKFKKIIACVVVAICVMLPAMFLVGCGNDEKQEYCWNKDFSWQKGMVINNLNTSFSQNSPTQKQLLQREFKKDNLDLTNITLRVDNSTYSTNTLDLGENEEGLKSADELIKLLNQEAFNNFESRFKDLTVSVGKKEENKITINGKNYELQLKVDSFYNIYDAENKTIVGSISDYMTRVNGFNTQNCLLMSLYDDPYCDIVITIPTKKPVEDLESDYIDGAIVASKITIKYTAYLTVV